MKRFLTTLLLLCSLPQVEPCPYCRDGSYQKLEWNEILLKFQSVDAYCWWCHGLGCRTVPSRPRPPLRVAP